MGPGKDHVSDNTEPERHARTSAVANLRCHHTDRIHSERRPFVQRFECVVLAVKNWEEGGTTLVESTPALSTETKG